MDWDLGYWELGFVAGEKLLEGGIGGCCGRGWSWVGKEEGSNAGCWD